MDQIAVVTGAASGLGLSLSERLIARGETVYGVTKTKRHWKQARKRVPDEKRFLLYQVDLTSESQVHRFLAHVYRKARRLDLLVNNAGYGGRLKRLEQESLQEFQKHLSTNLISTFLMCKHSLPYFKKQKRGWIINISSYAGKRAVPLLSAYSASKFGVVALTQSLVKENPGGGFKCLTLCPGGMNTEMRAKLFGLEDAQRQQDPDFVADKILEIIDGKIQVGSGSDVVIRHRQIAVINPLPGP